MSDPDEAGSVIPDDDHRRASRWPWLLALVLLLGVPVYVLLANLADSHDAVGIDFTFGECPSDAGAGGGDETTELVAEPQRFTDCVVEVRAPVYEVVDVNLVILQGPETDDRPVILVRPRSGDPMEVAGGDPVVVQGTARDSLDAALLAQNFDAEPDAYAKFAGEPYIAVDRLSDADPTAG
jgi:hypothetical protein